MEVEDPTLGDDFHKVLRWCGEEATVEVHANADNAHDSRVALDFGAQVHNTYTYTTALIAARCWYNVHIRLTRALGCVERSTCSSRRTASWPCGR